MTLKPDFIASLARSSKSCAKIKTTVDTACGDKALGITSINYIIKKAKAGKSTYDQSHLNTEKTKKTLDIVAPITVDVKEDRVVTCKDLTCAHGVSNGIMHNILCNDLGLVKKSTRWVA